MNTLPLEIENEIWNLHYMNLYKDNIVIEINKIKFLFNSIYNSCRKIKDKILSNQYINIIKEDIILINERITYMIYNKSFYLLFKNNDNYNYIYQISKFHNAYNDLPMSCRLAGAYLNKLGNFNSKLIKRLTVICNKENIPFYKNIARSIKP